MKNKWIEKNPLKWDKYQRDWRARNKSRIRAYHTKNGKKLSNYYKEWALKNKETLRIKKAQWYQNNKERVKKNVSDYWKQNRSKINQRREKYSLKYPERIKAQEVVRSLLKNGLEKLPCAVCGKTKSEAHHDDYSVPEKIIWLCRQHHSLADKIRRDKELCKKQSNI